MATGLSLSPLVGNRWNGHGDRSDNVIHGIEFKLSCANRLFGVACKMIRENKKYYCRAHSQVILGSGRSTLSVKPNTELRYRKLLDTQFLKVVLHFVAKD